MFNKPIDKLSVSKLGINQKYIRLNEKKILNYKLLY